jgi:hypothetical protein
MKRARPVCLSGVLCLPGVLRCTCCCVPLSHSRGRESLQALQGLQRPPCLGWSARNAAAWLVQAAPSGLLSSMWAQDTGTVLGCNSLYTRTTRLMVQVVSVEASCYQQMRRKTVQHRRACWECGRDVMSRDMCTHTQGVCGVLHYMSVGGGGPSSARLRNTFSRPPQLVRSRSAHIDHFSYCSTTQGTLPPLGFTR